MQKIILQRDGNENTSKDSEEEDSSEIIYNQNQNKFQKVARFIAEYVLIFNLKGKSNKVYT